jgi:hypothetical protein
VIVFIVPLRSSRVSTSWQKVCVLLERTLRSICNQTNPDFKVIVVCHEKPDINFYHPSISYIEVEFDIPTCDVPGKSRDQARKMWIGLQSAQPLRPDYIMFVDSDDCVSKKIVDFTIHHPSQHGWFVPQGYEHPDQSNTLYFRKKDFQYKCGTSYIFSHSSLQDFVKFNFDEITGRNFLFHQYSLNLMKSKNSPLDPLPFPGVVYITENGENYIAEKKNLLPPKKMGLKELVRYYGGALYKPMISTKLTNEIRDEFHLYSSVQISGNSELNAGGIAKYNS